MCVHTDIHTWNADHPILKKEYIIDTTRVLIANSIALGEAISHRNTGVAIVRSIRISWYLKKVHDNINQSIQGHVVQMRYYYEKSHGYKLALGNKKVFGIYWILNDTYIFDVGARNWHDLRGRESSYTKNKLLQFITLCF